MNYNITIYEQTKRTCMPCKMTKKYLDQRNIPYRIIDGDPHVESLRSEGFGSFPVVKTSIGDWCGLNMARLQELASAHHTQCDTIL